MDSYTEVYATNTQNAQINASSSEIFGITSTDIEQKKKHGSFNFLIITSLSSLSVDIQLDGLTTRRIATLLGAGAVKLDPRDGIYFDTLKITNLSASTAITAGDISLRYGKAVPVANGNRKR